MLFPAFFMFFVSLILSVIWVLSSESWFLIWFGLEINLLSFIPILLYKKSKYSSEASLKYFLIQVISSLFILINLFLNYLDLVESHYLIILGLMIKLGSAPLHQWMPSLVEGLSWLCVMVLLIVQKINPLFILFYVKENNFMFLFFILMSSFVGSLSGLNQISIRKIMIYSSISHLGWLMSSCLMSLNLCIMYFFFYSLVLSSVIIYLNFKQINNFNQLIINKKFFFICSLGFLSLGGLPPFTGFLPKLLVCQDLVINNNYFLLLILLSSTFLSLFYYMRMSISGLISFFSLNNNLNITLSNISFIMVNLLLFLFYPLLI